MWVLPDEPGASPLLIAEESGLLYLWPDVLPDGKTVIATTLSCAGPGCPAGRDDAQLVAISLESGEMTVLLDDGGRARFVASGHLVIGRDQELLAALFDLRTVQFISPPKPIFGNVMSTGRTLDAVYFDVSLNGNLVYVSQEFGFRSHVVQLVSPGGVVEPLPMRLDKPAISPDGRRIVGVPIGESHQDLQVFTLGRDGTPTQITFGSDTHAPIWTPEGERVTFADRRYGNYDLYWVPVNGSSAPALLHDSEHDLAPESWSPDGQILAFTQTEYTPDWNEDIWLLPVGGEARPFLQTSFIESGAAFSADGRWIAYHSNESGTFEVYLRPVPEDLEAHDASDVGYKLRISTECGGWPAWSLDGSELYFRNCGSPDSFWAVAIDTEPDEPVIGEPRYLFEGEYVRHRRGPSYSVAPDGRFLLVDQSAAVGRLEVILNWAEDLERLVPTGR